MACTEYPYYIRYLLGRGRLASKMPYWMGRRSLPPTTHAESKSVRIVAYIGHVGVKQVGREDSGSSQVRQRFIPSNLQWTPGGIQATHSPPRAPRGWLHRQAKVVKAMLRLFSHQATKADEADDEVDEGTPFGPPTSLPSWRRREAGKAAY